MMEPRYVLRVSLAHIEPTIWRRFEVPSGITLDRLHDVLQIVMGWTDSHLHEFRIGGERYTEYPEYLDGALHSGFDRLDVLVESKGTAFVYAYDFGDGWEHHIVLEEIDERPRNPRGAPICLDGERACPPEDVGGAPGYDAFLEALGDPAHEDHEAFMEWSGGGFDSEAFDPTEVNEMLWRYVRWSRDRELPWAYED